MADSWATNHRRYPEFAEITLHELRTLARQVADTWPKDASDYLARSDLSPELQALCRRRDALAVATTVFAAMAIESFVNYYGVVRLGQQEFAGMERQPLPNKLRDLLALDGLSFDESGTLKAAFLEVMGARNDLLHPKAEEVPWDQAPELRARGTIPQTQEREIAACRRFFLEFGQLLPSAKPLIPSWRPSEEL